MTTTYGMITNYEDVKTIETHGTPCKITIHRTHCDEIVGTPLASTATVGRSRGRRPNGLLPPAKKIFAGRKKVLDKPV